eukprot:6489712-Amphidinium_carterae.1
MVPMCSVARMVPVSTDITLSVMSGCITCALLVGMRLAGWHATPEQDVLTQRPRAGSAAHRADLVAITAMGLRLAFDVTLGVVTRIAERLAGGGRFCPLGMHARAGRLGPAAVGVLHWLAN